MYQKTQSLSCSKPLAEWHSPQGCAKQILEWLPVPMSLAPSGPICPQCLRPPPHWSAPASTSWNNVLQHCSFQTTDTWSVFKSPGQHAVYETIFCNVLILLKNHIFHFTGVRCSEKISIVFKYRSSDLLLQWLQNGTGRYTLANNVILKW